MLFKRYIIKIKKGFRYEGGWGRGNKHLHAVYETNETTSAKTLTYTYRIPHLEAFSWILFIEKNML